MDPSGPSGRLAEAEDELCALAIEAQTADWVYSTYVTPDTERLSARANARWMDRAAALARTWVGVPAAELTPEDQRKVHLLRVSLPTVAPSEPGASERLAGLIARMQAVYAQGRYRPAGAPEPVDLQGLSRILSSDRRPGVLWDVWQGWHRVGRGIREDFRKYVDLSNRGARELGFEDTGAMWRSRYDMPPAEFVREVERLWSEVAPLYRLLHAFVRQRLHARYGEETVPSAGPIPAHLLGNMWAQSWEAILPALLPDEEAGPGYDMTRILAEHGTTPERMVRTAEQFFISLGLPPLPPTFWERSMLVRPRDREVVCHASAWNLDFVEDLRIKMCIEITGEDFQTIHHELGHNYYQRAYARQPFLFRESAHDGFHEAVGDTIGLSVTPEYLVRIGLLERAPPVERDIGLLLRTALEKVAFLPFGLAVDRWRWNVFSGEISEREYTGSWWELRERLQGIRPGQPRGEDEFDPGAKFHVPASVPYMRYFLAHLLQFQFHRALARRIGATGPLHRVSIYGHPEAGRALDGMLRMGASRPWPEALEAIAGTRTMSAEGLLEYFRPLRRWLEEQVRGHPVGWAT
ncbi:MAG: M2 family metallopeptidase [Thermoplasmata archaeon]